MCAVQFESNIEQSDNFNFLIMIFNTDLNWSSHLAYISRKTSRAIGVINSLKCHFPLYILITLYNSMISPHFNCCLLIWGSNTKDFSYKRKLFVFYHVVYF